MKEEKVLNDVVLKCMKNICRYYKKNEIIIKEFIKKAKQED